MDDIAGHIHCFSFGTNHLLASTFLRFQEHYESPEFRGRVFTWEEFMDWYARELGAFTYLSDWCGFNLPDTAFDAFRRGDFDPLTRKERLLLDAVSGLERPFYVIGAVDDDASTMSHEIVHALFYLCAGYREDVLRALARTDLPELSRHLRSMGYDENVIDDEINAYLVGVVNVRMPRKGVPEVRKTLRMAFERHFGVKIWLARACRLFMKRCHRIELEP